MKAHRVHITPHPNPANEGPTTYLVVGVVESGSRGREYQLAALGSTQVVRVCHAPRRRVRAATTGGSRIQYEWANSAQGGEDAE